MSDCKSNDDAFVLAASGHVPMNVVAVVQHTSGEYLGLMEDHLEGRRIRFQYFRPFAGGGKLPASDVPADALLLLGGGPWGSAGDRDLPTLQGEIELTRAKLAEGTPIIGIGVGAQILAHAAGGGSERRDLTFEMLTARRIDDDALNGFLPESFHQVIYMRDWPLPPSSARILAEDAAGRPVVWQVGDNAYGFCGNPGIKLGMVEDLIMEFEEVAADAAVQLKQLRALQPILEDELVPIMTGLVQCTSLMSSPKAASKAGEELDTTVI